jgi:hypothetical protein
MAASRFAIWKRPGCRLAAFENVGHIGEIDIAGMNNYAFGTSSIKLGSSILGCCPQVGQRVVSYR